MKNVIVIVFVLGLCCLMGCEDRSAERIYEEVIIKAPEIGFSLAMDPHAGMPISPNMAGVSSSNVPLKWKVPDGWTELSGGGMRIVSFQNVKEPQAIDVSIVSLSGAAGGLEANLVRWANQIGLDLQGDPSKLKTLISAAQKLTTVSGHSGEIYDFRGIQQRDDPSLKSVIAAVVIFGDQTIFLKMTGSQQAIEDNLQAFKVLAQSLEPK